MANHEPVTQANETRLMEDWQIEITVFDQYEGHTDEFLQLLSEFADRCDRHPGCVRTARNGIELTSSYIRPVHSALYSAGPIVREFAAKDIQQILQEKVIELAITK